MHVVHSNIAAEASIGYVILHYLEMCIRDRESDSKCTPFYYG